MNDYNIMPRNNALQGLRAIAFLAIFISHCGIGNLGCLGAWGVSVFFVMSGFLMIYNYLPRETISKNSFLFACSKVKKLYPLHIIIMLLAAIFDILRGNTLNSVLVNVLIHSLLLQMWIPNEKYYATLNGPSWFLCTIFFSYFCFPYILRTFKKNLSKVKAIIYIFLLFIVEVIITFIAIWVDFQNNIWFDTKWIAYYSPITRLIDFLTGCFLGYVFLKSEKNLNIIWSSLLEIVTCIFICLSFVVYRSNLGVIALKYALLFLPTSTFLIWIVAKGNGYISKILSNKIFVKLGDLSPYTFLIHGVVLKYYNMIFNNIFLITNKYIISIIAFISTIFISILWIKISNYLVNLKNST